MAAAVESARVLKEIAARVEKGELVNQVIREMLPAARRSWAYRHWPAFQCENFEGPDRRGRSLRGGAAAGRAISTGFAPDRIEFTCPN